MNRLPGTNYLHIEGSAGVLSMSTPFMTHLGTTTITVETQAGCRSELQSLVGSYTFQARDFAALIRGQRPEIIPPTEDSVDNIRRSSFIAGKRICAFST